MLLFGLREFTEMAILKARDGEYCALSKQGTYPPSLLAPLVILEWSSVHSIEDIVEH